MSARAERRAAARRKTPGHAASSRQRSMITAEGLSLEFTRASRGARIGALVLDWVMLVAIILVVSVAMGYTVSQIADHLPKRAQASAANAPAEFLVILWLIGVFLLHNGWFLFFELGALGATPGKRIVGIRIAARGGACLAASQVIARNLLREVEIFAPLMLLSIFGEGAGWVAAGGWMLCVTCLPLWNRDALRAGDLIGGTWVVEAPRTRLAPVLSVAPRNLAAPHPEDNTAPAPLPHAYRFGEAELAAYGEYELQTLERVLREGRVEAMDAVALAIAARIGWTPPSADGAREFLSDYYTQLRARLEAGMRMGQRKADKFADGVPPSGAGHSRL